MNWRYMSVGIMLIVVGFLYLNIAYSRETWLIGFGAVIIGFIFGIAGAASPPEPDWDRL